MSKLFKVILTIILFLISLNYTNKVIDYIESKDPLMKEIIDKQDDYYIKPIDAVITKNIVIKEVKGRKINIKKSYQKMKKLGIFNESLLVYESVLPDIVYDKYDKVIIPNMKSNNISIVFDINDESLFYSINEILVNNNIEAGILFNNLNRINIKESNFKNILGTTYNEKLDYCINFNSIMDSDCINNQKYTLLIKENIISNNFLNNTKKAIDNHSNIIIYRFNQNNLTNLNTIIKYFKSNYINLTNIDYLLKL